MLYDKVEPNRDVEKDEKKISQFWNENRIFEKTMEEREGQDLYTFYDGPPTANGKPHIGHVLTRVIKDCIPRYHTMKGELVSRKAGWDTHGLPVEIEVEKKLGLDGKEQIEEYGLEAFITQCKESVWQYKEMWEDFSQRVGFWSDMEDPYVTYEDDFIESEWWALKEIWKKGLLYKGHKIVPYCPRCGTPLSSHEVAQGYKDVRERSAIARFQVKGEDAYILAWTTTPWTLPSNVALCVNPKETYVKVKMKEENFVYYLAEALADDVLGAGTYEVLETFKGTDLEYKEYEALYPAALDKKGYYVVCDDYVTMSDGTGVVHIAPAFGEDDNRVGQKYDLPFLQLVDENGMMTEETKWPGRSCVERRDLKDQPGVNSDVIRDLDERGLLFAAPKFEHSYPYCWRCDTPLIYYAHDTWFIRMTAVRDDLIRNNNTVNWIPPSIGKGRFGDWLENVQDWGISRDRYWGTPLNIWSCECGYMQSIGSKAELRELAVDWPDKVSDTPREKGDIELHRPYIDGVTIRCPKCGKLMHRVPEVIDCWFDSGSMPFAQYHYPFENQEYFHEHFPAQFISEAVDQTRGWFYSLMAVSTLIFNKAPFENVIVMGHVLDENGQKMSKSRGNAIDPFEALDLYGADAIRWYFYSSSAPWLPNRFQGKAVREGQRKFLGTLWNTYAFYVLYANIDNFNPMDYTIDYGQLPVMDRWLLSKMNSMIGLVDDHLAKYQIPEAARTLQEFVDDMSNWYVRRSRDRFWAKGMEQDKINAYMTLYTALVSTCKAAAPMIPFITEEIYQNIVRKVDPDAPESIHLCLFPECDVSRIDPTLEKAMDQVLKIVAMGRACRNAANRKNRQPLSRMLVKAPERLPEYFTEIIREELNVKEVQFTEEVSAYTSYTFKPQLRTVGPKYGRLLGRIREILPALDGNAAMAELKANGALKLEIDGREILLTEEDLLIDETQAEGFVSETNGALTVVLDIRLTPELIEEGYMRELISKIQTMRKEAGFEVMDRIRVSIKGNETLEGVMKRAEAEILKEVMADEILFGTVTGYTEDWNINGEPVTLGVEKLETSKRKD